MTIVNLEAGMPTVEQSRMKLDQALRTAKARRERVLKIIHGYGSSGRGGAIKRDVHMQLSRRKSNGQICVYCPGEQFSPFDAAARKILDACPELGRDRDYTRSNHGVTLVLL